MKTIVSLILLSVFLLLSLLHIYWAFGGKWAGEAVFPTKY